MPELYNQHYINKYSFPKGLSCIRKDPNTEAKRPRQSIYDMNAQPIRKGVSGWKLTKRIVEEESSPKGAGGLKKKSSKLMNGGKNILNSPSGYYSNAQLPSHHQTPGLNSEYSNDYANALHGQSGNHMGVDVMGSYSYQ